MGSGASKKATNENAANFDDEDDEDFDTFAKKKLGQNKGQNKGQPRLEQAGLLPKLQDTPPSSRVEKVCFYCNYD